MRARALLLALLLVALGGCVSLRGVGAFFSSPRPVVTNKQPIGSDARLAVVWIGHSTALVQIDDKVILTDPIFTSTVGQFSRRLVAPGVDPKDLPPVDAVLVSQLAYDHLSLGSLELIEPRVRTLLLPTGGTAYLTDGFSFPTYELRTWQAWEKDGLRVTAVPIEQVGCRYGIDAAWMSAAVTGYVVEYHGLKVYFVGDSAYDQAKFVETGQRFARIDLALLPIGPSEPRDRMRRYHMDPREALQSFIDLDAARMVPIHYGTFVSGTDEPDDALRGLASAQKGIKLGPRLIAPLSIGERRVFVKAGEGPPPPPASAQPAAAPAPTPAPSTTGTIPEDDSFE